MNYSWSRNQTTMLYAHLGNDYVKALIMRNLSLTLTHFDFTTLGGLFLYAPHLESKGKTNYINEIMGHFYGHI